MEWTTEKPTEPGFYWVLEGDESEIVLLFWYESSRRLIVFRIGYELEYELSDFTHWMGPIPEPDPPDDNALLVESGILPRLIDDALKQKPSEDWEAELDAM